MHTAYDNWIYMNVSESGLSVYVPWCGVADRTKLVFFFDTDGPGIDPVLLDGTYGVAPAVDSNDIFLTMAHGPVIP